MRLLEVNLDEAREAVPAESMAVSFCIRRKAIRKHIVSIKPDIRVLFTISRVGSTAELELQVKSLSTSSHSLLTAY